MGALELLFAAWVLCTIFAFATSPQGAAFGSFVSGIAALLAVLVAGIGGYFGFKAWRRELRGTTEYHVARRVLVATVKLSDAIASTRREPNPFLYHGRDVSRWESGEEILVLNAMQEYGNRLKELVPEVQELTIAEREAVALWGTHARAALIGLRHCASLLSSSASYYFSRELGRVRESKPPPRGQSLERRRRILYTQRDDWFGRHVDVYAQIADDFFRPHLR